MIARALSATLVASGLFALPLGVTFVVSASRQSPRNDLELGIGIALIVVGLIVAWRSKPWLFEVDFPMHVGRLLAGAWTLPLFYSRLGGEVLSYALQGEGILKYSVFEGLGIIVAFSWVVGMTAILVHWINNRKPKRAY